LREGTWQGSVDDGRIEWTTRVTPYDPPDANADLASASESMPVRLYRVDAEVSFAGPSGTKRSFALATTRLGAREAR
jgi:hypothetical protein